MATFGELQTKVSTRLKDPNNVEISSSIVADVINDAVAHWSKRRYWFNEFKESVTLAQNDPNLPALNVTPLYLFKNYGIVIDYASTRWPLRQISGAEYDDINVEGRGIPYAWTERNQGFELYWYPDAAYTAIVRGVKAYPALTANLETNDFTINATDLILYETLSRLYGEFRQDPKMEAYYNGRANNEHQSLKRQTRRDKGVGRINVEGF